MEKTIYFVSNLVFFRVNYSTERIEEEREFLCVHSKFGAFYEHKATFYRAQKLVTSSANSSMRNYLYYASPPYPFDSEHICYYFLVKTLVPKAVAFH